MTRHRPTNIAKSIEKAAGKIEALIAEQTTAWQTLVLAEVMATVIAAEPAHLHGCLISKGIKLIESILLRDKAAEESRE